MVVCEFYGGVNVIEKGSECVIIIMCMSNIKLSLSYEIIMIVAQ